MLKPVDFTQITLIIAIHPNRQNCFKSFCGVDRASVAKRHSSLLL